MRLLIPKDKAIKILQDRISGLDEYNFNSEAWKERTVLDLKEIFPLGSTQYIKIQFLNFETYISSEKQKVFAEAKATAKKVLNSYIDFINEYSQVAEEKKVIKEKDFEQKYYDLLKDRNQVVTDYNDLVKNYEEQIETNSELIDKLNDTDRQLQTVKADTIQLDNISVLKLWKAFLNLPLWQIVSFFSVLVAIIIGSFALGKTYAENASNTQQFDLKIENKSLKDQKANDDTKLLEQDKKIKTLKQKLDSATKK